MGSNPTATAKYLVVSRDAGYLREDIAVNDPYENLHATIDALQRRKTDEATTGLLAFQARVLVEILDELHRIRQVLPDTSPLDREI